VATFENGSAAAQAALGPEYQMLYLFHKRLEAVDAQRRARGMDSIFKEPWEMTGREQQAVRNSALQYVGEDFAFLGLYNRFYSGAFGKLETTF
jgi:hypothetical protein